MIFRFQEYTRFSKVTTFFVAIPPEAPSFYLWHIKHYENTPIQMYIENFTTKKKENFQVKNSDIFHIPAQNIDCGYSLEPLRWGCSNEYTQSMFLSRNKKNPCKPSFII